MNPYLDLPSPAQPEAGRLASVYGLDNHGLANLHRVYWNLPTASLYEEVVFRGEARISHLGPIVVTTIGPRCEMRASPRKTASSYNDAVGRFQ